MPAGLLLIFSLLALFTVYCAFVFLFFFSSFRIKSIIDGAPPVPTPKKDIKLALSSIELSEGDLFYDLGSGTGKAVIMADKSFGADARGLEHSLFWSFFSRINILVHQSDGEMIRGDFLKEKLSKADAIYSYTSKPLMKKLERKILDEEINAKIVSYCFPFPNLSPEKIVKTEEGKNIFIYQT